MRRTRRGRQATRFARSSSQLATRPSVATRRRQINTQILAIFNGERQEVPSLIAGQDGYVALTETPFYLEAGGQVSDAGTIAGPAR